MAAGPVWKGRSNEKGFSIKIHVPCHGKGALRCGHASIAASGSCLMNSPVAQKPSVRPADRNSQRWWHRCPYTCCAFLQVLSSPAGSQPSVEAGRGCSDSPGCSRSCQQAQTPPCLLCPTQPRCQVKPHKASLCPVTLRNTLNFSPQPSGRTHCFVSLSLHLSPLLLKTATDGFQGDLSPVTAVFHGEGVCESPGDFCRPTRATGNPEPRGPVTRA